MKELGKIVVGAAVACAFSSGAIAQVRTFGPAAPYLLTGRSVSVPPYDHHDQKVDGEGGAHGQLGPGADSAPDHTPSDEAAPR